MTTSLCKLSTKYGTDKGYPHRYTPIYHQFLGPCRTDIKRVLEVGICVKRDLLNGRTGASLYMWEEFFPDADIFGIDIDPNSMVNEGRIKSAVADQTNLDQMVYAVEMFGARPFDVIVDDGSHVPEHQISCANILLPYLDRDGFYFIEDIYVDPEVIKQGIGAEIYDVEVFEGGKPLPEGYGRREWGGPPAGECLMLIRHR